MDLDMHYTKGALYYWAIKSNVTIIAPNKISKETMPGEN